jgi:hypothetical protein
MTLNELLEHVMQKCPNVLVGKTDDGEITFYTGMKGKLGDRDETLIPIEK